MYTYVVVGSNVDKFCRDAAKMHQLDKSVKETNVMRSVAGWHEKQVWLSAYVVKL